MPDSISQTGIADEDRPDLLPYLAAYVQQRRDRNLDTYIAVSGREGWGKSSLALTAALHLEPDLDPDTVILDQEDYYEVYDPGARDGVYIFDEAARLFFNRNWNRRHQKALIQEVIENRQNRNVMFLVLPQFKSLDKYTREGRVDLWFACTGQGRAMIRQLQYNAYEEEAYYPIIVHDHTWDALEATHPEFARAYYRRKAQAHKAAFAERVRRNAAQDDKAEAREEYREARKKAILATKD